MVTATLVDQHPAGCPPRSPRDTNGGDTRPGARAGRFRATTPPSTHPPTRPTVYQGMTPMRLRRATTTRERASGYTVISHGGLTTTPAATCCRDGPPLWPASSWHPAGTPNQGILDTVQDCHGFQQRSCTMRSFQSIMVNEISLHRAFLGFSISLNAQAWTLHACYEGFNL